MKYKKGCFLIFSTGVKCRTTSLAGCSHFSKVLRPLWSSQATNGDSKKWVILIRVRNSCLLPSHFSYTRNLLWCNKRGTRKRSKQWFKSRSMHRENKIKIYCCTWKSLMERWKQCVMWFIRQPPNKQRCLWLFWLQTPTTTGAGSVSLVAILRWWWLFLPCMEAMLLTLCLWQYHKETLGGVKVKGYLYVR